VTSAVRPIPLEWRNVRRLTLAVSIDGLQPEHDRRRDPATYERVLRNIRGHAVTVHCTVTRQMTRRVGYLREFVGFWVKQPEVRKIWMSLYTPQIGESSPEILPLDVRERVINELSALESVSEKLELPAGLLEAYRRPPEVLTLETKAPVFFDARSTACRTAPEFCSSPARTLGWSLPARGSSGRAKYESRLCDSNGRSRGAGS
jgi:hypothetical protein